MRTTTTHHMTGRLSLNSNVFTSGGVYYTCLSIIEEGGSINGDISIFVDPADNDRIAEAVAAFNEIMRRPSLQEAAE